jgi:hypothetical protein
VRLHHSSPRQKETPSQKKTKNKKKQVENWSGFQEERRHKGLVKECTVMVKTGKSFRIARSRNHLNAQKKALQSRTIQ